MGSNIAGFANGFIKKVNRNFEEAKMARYEQFIHDQEQADLKLTRDEKQRIDQQKATDLAAAQGVLYEQQNQFTIDKEGRAANRQEEEWRNFYRTSNPGMSDEEIEDLVNLGQTGYSMLSNVDPDLRWKWENNIWISPEDQQETRAHSRAAQHAPLIDPGTGARMDPETWKNTEAYKHLVTLNMAAGGDGWTEFHLAGAKIVIDPINPVSPDAPRTARIVMPKKDPDMHTPLPSERAAITDAVDVKLSFLNSSSPYLFDATGNLLQGDAATAVNSLRQKVLTEYVRLRSLGRTDVDEQRITDAIFDPFMDFLPAVSPENRGAVDNILNADNRLDVIGSMTNIDDLINIYKNLNDRIELSNNDIIQTGDVDRMQEVADAIDNNSTFKSYMAELSDESVVLPEDAPRVLLSGPGGEAGNPILDEQLRKEAERINTEKVENARATISGAQRKLNALNDRVQRLSNNINAQKQKMEEAGIPITNIPQTLYDQLSEAQRKLVAGQQRFGSIIEAAEAIIPSPPVEERSGPPGVK